MTEKIARRGVRTPHSYESDILDLVIVQQVMEEHGMVLSANATIDDVRQWLQRNKSEHRNYFIVVNDDASFRGIVSSSNLFSMHHSEHLHIGSLIKRMPIAITASDSLKTAVEMMATENVDVLPVITSATNKVIGLLSYRSLLSAYKHRLKDHEEKVVPISLKRRSLKILLQGKRRLISLKEKE